MSAPMTRERLALIRDEYGPALDDSYSEACVAVDVEDLRELLDACEALLSERDSVRDAAFREGWDAAVGECNRAGGEKALQFMKANREAARGALAVADAVFALKGKR